VIAEVRLIGFDEELQLLRHLAAGDETKPAQAEVARRIDVRGVVDCRGALNQHPQTDRRRAVRGRQLHGGLSVCGGRQQRDDG